MNQEFKDLINRIKFEYGLTQKEIAEKLGVNGSYISEVISGKYPFSDSLKENIRSNFFRNEVRMRDHGNSQIIHNNSGTAINGGDEKTVVDRMQDQIDSLLAQNDKLLTIIENLTKK